MTEGQDDYGATGFYQRAKPIYPESEPPVKRRSLPYFVVSLLLLLVIGISTSVVISHSEKSNDLKKMQGKVAMTTQELKEFVTAKHLTVYWAGPVASDKYALVVQKTGEAFVRYLPGGKGLADTGSTFRIIATYVQKNAFSTTQAAGAQAGNVGFTNVDGNAIFYVKSRPTNVFVGIEGKNIQLEIFDPSVDQALAIAMFRGEIQQIK